MLDIQQLRNELDLVAVKLAKRGYEFPVEQFRALEQKRKVIQTETQELQAKRNTVSKQIGIAKQKGEAVTAMMAEIANLGDNLKQFENQLEQIQSELQKILLVTPNLAHESVPEGKDDKNNLEIRRWGEPRVFDFEIKDHVTIGEQLGMLDF